MNVPYVQCELRNGDRSLTTWVPRKLAQKGKELRLKRVFSGKGELRFEGEPFTFSAELPQWEIGWVVEKVFKDKVLTGTDLDTIRDEYRFHRRRTDV